jgi:hypothetical protein
MLLLALTPSGRSAIAILPLAEHCRNVPIRTGPAACDRVIEVLIALDATAALDVQSSCVFSIPLYIHLST